MSNKRGKSFVVIMIVIAVTAFLLRFAIEMFISKSMLQNQSNAEGTLKLIAAALENYAKDNQGVYPEKFSLLTAPKPPYLDRDYVNLSSLKGYIYTCARLEKNGYSCTAAPAQCGLTGMKVYTVTSGGIFVSDECSKKE